MIQVRDSRGNYHEALAIYDNAGREIKEVRNNQGRLLFKNWNEIQGSPPITFRGHGKNLTECRIYGNTAQNGTPTPETPVEVQGCGVRTGNLFDGYLKLGSFSAANGEDYPNTASCITNYTGVMQSKAYTASVPIGCYIRFVGFYGDNRAFLGYVSNTEEKTGAYTFDTPYSTKTIRIVFAYKSKSKIIISEFPSDKIMLNAGSTALPYEPYGYKIPLTVNGTEYPIYLGQVETTRRIKKLVLTGDENWLADSVSYKLEGLPRARSVQYENNQISSHYTLCISLLARDIQDGQFYVYNNFLRIKDLSYPNAASFKSYLAAQYAAGTPVTIWYVLYEPETGIVNEPIQKIGDYSDELSIADVPTISGINTISADTTVLPSEIYIKGKIKSIT